MECCVSVVVTVFVGMAYMQACCEGEGKASWQIDQCAWRSRSLCVEAECLGLVDRLAASRSRNEEPDVGLVTS